MLNEVKTAGVFAEVKMNNLCLLEEGSGLCVASCYHPFASKNSSPKRGERRKDEDVTSNMPVLL